jgi:cytochrome c oxidase subunit II
MGSLIERYLDAASTYASDIDGLITLVAILVGFWGVLAEIVLIGLVIAYREKPGQAAQYITGDQKHEKAWIAYPHYLVLVCDVLIIFAAVRVWYNVEQASPPADATVRVIAQQWAWTFVQPGPDNKLDTADDISTSDELHVKVNTLYHYKLESRDVLHSFSVPVFRLKHDAIPGRVISGWFEPTKAGTFDIQCVEMCGIGHALMPARIVVESAAEHAAWMAKNAPPVATAAAAPQAK